MTTGQIIAATARLWLEHGSPWMDRAQRELTAFSPPMAELGLRELFEDIAANVEELERREAPPTTRQESPFTVAHVLSGNLPNPGIVSIIAGLLSGARNVVKPGAGDPMPGLFVESLSAVNLRLARRVTLTSDREAYRRADAVIAYGNDETMAALKRNREIATAPRPHHTPRLRDRCAKAPAIFFGFGHRVSIGVVDSSHSAIRDPRSTISAAARDASLWDQQGCMSPQCFYVRGDPAVFAAALAREMAAFDRRWPRAPLSFKDATAVARARNEWGFRGRVWTSRNSTHWTVVLDERDGWAASPLNRFVFVRPIKLLTPALAGRLPLSTVGFAGFTPKDVAAMARADRYCSLGEMQRPSLLLTNSSRPRVGDLAAPASRTAA